MPPLLHMTRTRSEHRKVYRFAAALFAGLALVLMSGCNKLAEVFSLSGIAGHAKAERVNARFVGIE